MRIDRGILAIAFLALAATAVHAQQAIRWQPTLESAQRLAAQTNRLVLVHFWADWCGACKRLESEVLSQPTVAAAIQTQFVPVKVNADHFPATCKQMGVTAFPTDVILTPDGQVVQQIKGAAGAGAYLERLRQAVALAKPPARSVAANVRGPSAPTARSTPPNPYMASAVVPAQQPPTGYPAYPGAPAATGSNGPAGPPAVRRPAEMALGPAPPIPAQRSGPRQPTMPSGPAVGAQAGPAGPAPGVSATAAASAPGRSAPPRAPAATKHGPLCLEGYCPVELSENGKWVAGDREYGIRHKGRTYLFAGPEQAQRFWNNPDRYAPAHSGHDVVLFVEQGEMAEGSRRHGVFFGEKIYLFSSESTLERFSQNPHHYVNQLAQAMRAKAATTQM